MDADESRGLARTLMFPNRVVRAKVLTTIGDSIFLTKAMCFWVSASCSAKDRSFSFTLAQGFYTGFLHHIYSPAYLGVFQGAGYLQLLALSIT